MMLIFVENVTNYYYSSKNDHCVIIYIIFLSLIFKNRCIMHALLNVSDSS